MTKLFRFVRKRSVGPSGSGTKLSGDRAAVWFGEGEIEDGRKRNAGRPAE